MTVDRGQMLDCVVVAWEQTTGHEYQTESNGAWELVTLTQSTSPRRARIRWYADEVCLLEVGGCTCADFAYDDTEKAEVLREQVARAAEYVHGTAQCWETAIGERVVARRVLFQDGYAAVWQLSGLQRLMSRLGKPTRRAVERRVSLPAP